MNPRGRLKLRSNNISSHYEPLLPCQPVLEKKWLRSSQFHQPTCLWKWGGELILKTAVIKYSLIQKEPGIVFNVLWPPRFWMAIIKVSRWNGLKILNLKHMWKNKTGPRAGLSSKTLWDFVGSPCMLCAWMPLCKISMEQSLEWDGKKKNLQISRTLKTNLLTWRNFYPCWYELTPIYLTDCAQVTPHSVKRNQWQHGRMNIANSLPLPCVSTKQTCTAKVKCYSPSKTIWKISPSCLKAKREDSKYTRKSEQEKISECIQHYFGICAITESMQRS